MIDIEVTSEDREFWLQDAIPQEFLGQRPFEPLREKARRTVDFPRYHPLMFEDLGRTGRPLVGAPDSERAGPGMGRRRYARATCQPGFLGFWSSPHVRDSRSLGAKGN